MLRGHPLAFCIFSSPCCSGRCFPARSRVARQSGEQREFTHKNLLSPPDHSHRRGVRRSGLLLISFVVLALMMVGFHTLPGWPVLLLPAFVLLAFFAALGTGLWLSALNVRYRDVTQIVPFLVKIWMLASPVIYSIETIMKSHMQWRILYFADPMVEVICGFRWPLLGGAPPAPILLLWSAGTTLALLITVCGILSARSNSFRILSSIRCVRLVIRLGLIVSCNVAGQEVVEHWRKAGRAFDRSCREHGCPHFRFLLRHPGYGGQVAGDTRASPRFSPVFDNFLTTQRLLKWSVNERYRHSGGKIKQML